MTSPEKKEENSPSKECVQEEAPPTDISLEGKPQNGLNIAEASPLETSLGQQNVLKKVTLEKLLSKGEGDKPDAEATLPHQATIPDLYLLDHSAVEGILGKKKEKTIWDLAVEENRKIEQYSKYAVQSTEFTTIFVGTERSGKTSIIYRFIERSDPPRPTVALDYMYAKRSKGLDTGQELCHIWEVGCGILNAHLLEIPLNLSTITRSCFILTLDLNQLVKADSIFETYLGTFRQFVKELVEGAGAVEMDVKKLLKKEAWRRLGENVQDKKQLSPFPVPLIIFGTKYDLFQNMETEKRKAACRYLRMFTVINGCFLNFVCNKGPTLVGKPRSVLNHVVFGSSISKNPILDHTKPLYIPFGTDSIEAISGIPTTKQSVPEQFEDAKKVFHQHFPQVALDSEPKIDPSRDVNFQEREIDILKEKKDLEFQILLQDWLASLKSPSDSTDNPNPFLLRDIQTNIDLLNVELKSEIPVKEGGFVIREQRENELPSQDPQQTSSPDELPSQDPQQTSSPDLSHSANPKLKLKERISFHSTKSENLVENIKDVHKFEAEDESAPEAIRDANMEAQFLLQENLSENDKQ